MFFSCHPSYLFLFCLLYLKDVLIIVVGFLSTSYFNFTEWFVIWQL